MGRSFQNTTPPMGNTDYDCFEDNSYFSKTYVPLSSLPTPPMSSDSTAFPRQHTPAFETHGNLDPTLLGPAIHLSNLIPSAVSLADPSVHLVHTLLVRADLPLPTLALAVSILDSLNSRFALSWRRSCPLPARSPSPNSPRPHIDSIRPEIIILASLIISVKFLDDHENSTRLYSEDWGNAKWNCEQINATEQCIMENLGYRILPLWTEELIGDALEDMIRAGDLAHGSLRMEPAEATPQKLIEQPMGCGVAMWTDENQLTPALTPKLVNVHQYEDGADFFGSKAAVKKQDKAAGRSFPSYSGLGLGLTGV